MKFHGSVHQQSFLSRPFVYILLAALVQEVRGLVSLDIRSIVRSGETRFQSEKRFLTHGSRRSVALNGFKSYLQKTFQRRNSKSTLPGDNNGFDPEELDQPLTFHDDYPSSDEHVQGVIQSTEGLFTGSPTADHVENENGSLSRVEVTTEEASGATANSTMNGQDAIRAYPSSSTIVSKQVLYIEDAGASSSVDVLENRVTERYRPTDDETTKSLDKPLYTLTPVNRTLSDLEQEFRNMLETFSNYSQNDIRSLQEERVRVLFEGVAASAHEPAVYRAFEVLFEDLYPLRVAARVIYKKLCKLIEDSKLQRERDVSIVVEATGLNEAQVEACRLAFVTTGHKINRGAFFTTEQLISTGFLDEARSLVHPGPAELLMQELDQAENGQVSFTDLVIGLYDCVSQECSVERSCDTLLLLEGIMKSIADVASRAFDDVVDVKKVDHGRRYDEMLDSFREWRDMIPQGKGRRMDVIRGCFVGAENKEVVRALRICYVDYSGLRLAAEIIFKLVKSYMAGRKRALLKSK